MKIKHTHRYGTDILDVFGIYWGVVCREGGREEAFTSFYVARRNEEGLAAYGSDEVVIIDPCMSGTWVYHGGNIKGVFYAPLIKEELLDDLLDRDPVAFEKFLQHAKRDGLLDPDFY